ncbi:unnamed protein product, partial [Brassica rapa subsp. trilocularis]
MPVSMFILLRIAITVIVVLLHILSFILILRSLAGALRKILSTPNRCFRLRLIRLKVSISHYHITFFVC